MMAEVNKQLSVKHRNPTTITEHVRSSVWFVEKMTMACRRAGRKVITGRVPRPKKSSEVDKLSCPSELATAEVEENDEKKGWKTSSKEKVVNKSILMEVTCHGVMIIFLSLQGKMCLEKNSNTT